MVTIPPGWSRQPAQFDDGEWSVRNPWAGSQKTPLVFESWQYAEFYLGPDAMVVLWFPEIEAEEDDAIADVANEERVLVHAAVYPRGHHWFILEVHAEGAEYFDSRADAIADAAEVAHDVLTARLRMPVWRREDLRRYLHWFITQQPNRMDYVKLFRSNDSNGDYWGLLREPIEESQETFVEVFGEDYGPFTFPSARRQAIFGTFANPRPNPKSKPAAIRRRLVRR